MAKQSIPQVMVMLTLSWISTNALKAQVIEDQVVDSVEGDAGATIPEAVHLDEGDSARPVKAGGVGAGRSRDLRGMIERADLVFRGVVANVEYKLSEPAGAEQLQVPHTFVTYWVDEVISGPAVGDQITLRFMGGLDERTMLYMSSPHFPQFDVGDEDVLFVRGNTRSICPLVEQSRGRFRVIDGRVYGETGQEVLVGDKGELQLGVRRPFEEVLTTQVAGRAMITQRASVLEAANRPSNAADVETFVEHVRRLSRKVTVGGLFVNADPQAVLSGPDLTPAAPPAAKPGEDVVIEEPEREASGPVEEVMPDKQ